MSIDNTTTDADAVDEPNRIGAEPIDGDGTYPFAGLTRWDEVEEVTDLPENVWRQQSSMRYWAEGELDAEDPDPSVLPERGLSTMIPELPRATTADVAWIHPRTGEVIRTAKHNAVIEPERAEGLTFALGTPAQALNYVTEGELSVDEAQASIEEEDLETVLESLPEGQREAFEDMTVGDDALFHIPTDDYTVINPAQFLEPLCEVLQDYDLADKVYGEVRLDRGGGRATLDVYFDGKHVETPVFTDGREPVVVGMQVQWDFFGDWAVRACGQGLDWACANTIHRLTDREIVKHRGDVESRQDWYAWFEQIIHRLDEKRDQLARIIQAASETTLDFSDLPADIDEDYDDPWMALYAYMDLPNYLARYAGERLRSRAEDAYAPNFWEIHSAATYAVTHHSQAGDFGGAIEDHAHTANDMLMNPGRMGDRVERNYVRARRDEEQDTLSASGGGEVQIQNAFQSAQEKKEEFEEWEDELADLGIEL